MARPRGLGGSVSTAFDPEFRFETSWLVSPWVLFVIRAVISLYALFVSFFIIGWEASHAAGYRAGRSFSYFTVLTYWGLAFYFLFAALHTYSFARSGRPLLNSWPRPLQALHSVYYTTVVTYPFLVTVVYWAILYPRTWFPTRFGAWSNLSQHAFNAVFALFEVIVPRTSPPPWLHLLPLIIILALYLGLVYIVHAAQGFYTYPFLDRSKNSAAEVAAYVFGILATVVVIFSIVRLAICVRKRFSERGRTPKFGRPTVGYDRGGSAESAEMEERTGARRLDV